MLSPRLNNCIDCATIPVLLSDINQKIAELAQVEYNNLLYSTNYPIPAWALGDLLNYQRILEYKACNIEYAMPFTVQMIASRVKVLIHK
jgi:hypothetical protein